MTLALGVDLGGTQIKAGVTDAKGNILHFISRPTPKTSPEDLIKELADIVSECERMVSGTFPIGIGVPAVFDACEREVIMAPNLITRDYPLREKVESALGRKIVMDNDANMAALGEWWLGAGKNFRNILFVTLGTGVGGGIILDGQVYAGSAGLAGEIGHTIVFPNGEQCACGKKGCLETYASAAAISRRYNERNNSSNKTEEIFALARAGNASAQKVLDEAIFSLAVALHNYVLSFNPESIIIGGGMANAGEQLLSPLKKQLNDFLKIYPEREVTLLAATMGNKAGFLGAAKRAFDMKERF